MIINWSNKKLFLAKSRLLSLAKSFSPLVACALLLACAFACALPRLCFRLCLFYGIFRLCLASGNSPVRCQIDIDIYLAAFCIVLVASCKWLF